MANPKIFCNVPWTNLHIYWDGRYGACCSERSTPYPESEAVRHTLQSQSAIQWFNSDAMKDLRKKILSDTPLPGCAGCYHEESFGHESRRIKENFKSAIFTNQAFNESYDQSHWNRRFESAMQGADQSPPIDWHVDLGNECNLACKMCFPQTSSKIAALYRKWDLPVATNKNWVNDKKSWQTFKHNLDQTPVNRLHFMGGEPTLSKRFLQILDYLIDQGRLNVSISFVTNGTLCTSELVEKLKKFRSADVEVSIEAVNRTNDYIRQGSDWNRILANLTRLIENQTDTFRVALRSVPQLLSINTYASYIDWAWQHGLPIQSIPATMPAHLSIDVLPIDIRSQLIGGFQSVKEKIQSQTETSFASMYTGRDPTRIHLSLAKECDTMINLLSTSEPENVDALRADLAAWLTQWDSEFKLNAFEYYPEYQEFLKKIGYGKV